MQLNLGRDAKLTGFLTHLPSAFISFQSKISFFIAALLVVCTAWITGQLVWQLAEQSDTSVSRWSAKPVIVSQPLATRANPINEILNANLFGKYSENNRVKQVVKPVVQNAPQTRLNLILVGAVTSSNEAASLAVISNKGKQATYGIGEQIEGTQAKLKAVFVDRVIIDNSGRDETLMLEGVKYSKISSGTETQQPQRRGVGNNPTPAGDDLSSIRNQILEDPRSILNYIQLSQVKKDGQLMGYRVRPGSQRKLFDSVGLKEGDIAIGLNGEDLTDPASMGKIWQSINDLTELNLTVERDGQNYDIYIEF
ncbi:type II secretion system protein GspC [Vibrio sp. SCSIO 43137]|uniref:type II secretion system protein GspC n=1 Tax=Vibrio sp. SCSIO 43137 TaxID=3021011 RepID=UPI0023079B4C|nr:type II secretion system protein GspC [Vibrio sp. SCSIO 43137]WCE29799.1 type II secretion system protein GspC [Vibrio sp. SCSIO 43137]